MGKRLRWSCSQNFREAKKGLKGFMNKLEAMRHKWLPRSPQPSTLNPQPCVRGFLGGDIGGESWWMLLLQESRLLLSK